MTTSNHGRDILRLWKIQSSSPGPRPALLVGTDFHLGPVATEPGLTDLREVEALTEWRNENRDRFLTQFDATTKRTNDWLTDVVGPSDKRILFMLRDNVKSDEKAYLGLAFIDWQASYGEADAIVRGASLPRGTMKLALNTLLDWAVGTLGLSEIGVRVRSDNPAMAFYKKVGFRETDRVALKREEGSDGVNWTECPDLVGAELSLVHYRLDMQERPQRGNVIGNR